MKISIIGIMVILVSLLTLANVSLGSQGRMISFVQQCGSNILVVYSNGSVMLENPSREILYITQINFTRIIGLSQQIVYPWGVKQYPESFQHTVLIFLNQSGYYGLILPSFYSTVFVLNSTNITYTPPMSFPLTVKKVIYVSPYFPNMTIEIINNYLVQYNNSEVIISSLSNAVINSLNFSINDLKVFENATVVNNVILDRQGHVIYPSIYNLGYSNVTSVYFYQGNYFYEWNCTLYEDGTVIYRLNFSSSITKIYSYNGSLYVFFSNGYLLDNKHLIYIGKYYNFLDNQYVIINNTVYSLNLERLSPQYNFTPIYYYDGIVMGNNLCILVANNMTFVRVREAGLPPESIWLINDSGILYYTDKSSVEVFNLSKMLFYSVLPYYVESYGNYTVLFSPVYQRLNLEPSVVPLNLTITLFYTPLGNYRLTIHTNITSSYTTIILPAGYYTVTYGNSKVVVKLINGSTTLLLTETTYHTSWERPHRSSDVSAFVLALTGIAVIIILILRNIIKR